MRWRVTVLPVGEIGKTVLITGGNSGIGKAAAVGVAGLGARVVITSRNKERGHAARRLWEASERMVASVRAG
jgi:dehydrogenase/reductase SDR family protein 12